MMKHIQGQRMNKKIELITFDLDDTLWDNMPTIRKAEIDTRKWIEDKVGRIEWGDFDDFLNFFLAFSRAAGGACRGAARSTGRGQRPAQQSWSVHAHRALSQGAWAHRAPAQPIGGGERAAGSGRWRPGGVHKKIVEIFKKSS